MQGNMRPLEDRLGSYCEVQFAGVATVEAILLFCYGERVTGFPVVYAAGLGGAILRCFSIRDKLSPAEKATSLVFGCRLGHSASRKAIERYRTPHESLCCGFVNHGVSDR